MGPDRLPFAVPAIGEAEVEAAASAMRTGWLSCGPKVLEFEREFAAYVNAGSGGTLATGSGTAAMAAALGALGPRPGDAVFVPTLTFPATANVVRHHGLTPVLVDVDSVTLDLDPKHLGQVIDYARRQHRRLLAVMPVHFGGMAYPAAVDEVAAQHRMAVVEDAAHAIPTYRSDGRLVGEVRPEENLVRMTAFSFYATKNLTTGEGGMLTGPPSLIAKARPWTLHGMSRPAWDRHRGGGWYFDVVAPGFKANMTDPAAAVGLVQLHRLRSMQDRRHTIAERYDEAFVDEELLERPPRPDPLWRHAWHLYVVKLRLDRLSIERDEVIARAGDAGVTLNVHFTPLHQMQAYSSPHFRYGYAMRGAERAYPRLVSLPLHPGLTNADVDRVIDVVTTVLEGARR